MTLNTSPPPLHPRAEAADESTAGCPACPGCAAPLLPSAEPSTACECRTVRCRACAEALFADPAACPDCGKAPAGPRGVVGIEAFPEIHRALLAAKFDCVCGTPLAMAAAEEHYKTCEALCCQHCGFAQANPEELANHVEVHCTKRIIICENGCGAEVPAGKLEAHFLACTKRLVPCGFAACDYMGSFDAMPQHEQTCAFRTSGTADPNFLLHDATKAHSKSFSTSSSMPQQEPNQRKHPARNVSFFGVSSPRRVQEPAKDGPGVAFQEATTL